MKYAKNFLHLFTFSQIIYLSTSEPLFGSEKVHIKIHVPEQISHNFHDAAMIRKPRIRISHQNPQEQRKHAPYKYMRTKLRHNQPDAFLENFLFSDLKTNFDDGSIEELTGNLLHTTDEAAYWNVYMQITPKKPMKYIDTFKVIEYKEPILGKNEYQNHPNHFDHHQNRATYTETGYKSAYTKENSHEYAPAVPIMELIPNTNPYLPPFENPLPSIDPPNLNTNVLLPPKETLTLPVKEAEDFHSSASYNTDFLPFIGDMYLPVREQSSVAPEATETYIGFDSYSARHVQGIDDQT